MIEQRKAQPVPGFHHAIQPDFLSWYSYSRGLQVEARTRSSGAAPTHWAPGRACAGSSGASDGSWNTSLAVRNYSMKALLLIGCALALVGVSYAYQGPF